MSKPINRDNFLAAFSATSLALMLLTLCAAARAGATTQPTGAFEPIFPKGSFTLSTAAGYARGLDKDEADIGALEVGANYYIRDNFSLGGEISGYGISQPGDEAQALSLAFTLRHHFYQYDSFTLFFDGGFGPWYGTREVPQGGTHFNFLSRLGLGASYRLDEHLHLLFGARYWHLSNARIEGVDRNPNINGIEGYVGLMWQF